MILTSNYYISLDLYQKNYKIVRAKQNDIGRRIVVSCTENGRQFVFDETILAKVEMIKPDDHFVLNDAAVSVVDNSVTIELSEQMLACTGTSQMCIKLLSTESETVLSTMDFSLVVEESIVKNEDIESLDEYTTINNLIIHEHQRINSLNNLEQSIGINEAERIGNEDLRKDNEDIRIINEENREKNENTRISNENDRIQEENIRKTSESSRVSNEDERIEHEDIRISNEDVRISSEESRISNESDRVSNEISRIDEETNRAASEVIRLDNETTRESNENTRLENEENRVSSELIRNSSEETRNASEADRISAEETRVSNENTRAANEEHRAEVMEEIERNMEQLENLVGSISIYSEIEPDIQSNGDTWYKTSNITQIIETP